MGLIRRNALVWSVREDACCLLFGKCAHTVCISCITSNKAVQPCPAKADGMGRVLNEVGHGVQFGYTVYRRVLGYYSGEEDAFDMRKAMPRDVLKRSVVPLKRPVKPEELECD